MAEAKKNNDLQLNCVPGLRELSSVDCIYKEGQLYAYVHDSEGKFTLID